MFLSLCMAFNHPDNPLLQILSSFRFRDMFSNLTFSTTFDSPSFPLSSYSNYGVPPRFWSLSFFSLSPSPTPQFLKNSSILIYVNQFIIPSPSYLLQCVCPASIPLAVSSKFCYLCYSNWLPFKCPNSVVDITWFPWVCPPSCCLPCNAFSQAPTTSVPFRLPFPLLAQDHSSPGPHHSCSSS